jgi:hypothetical protein
LRRTDECAVPSLTPARAISKSREGPELLLEHNDGPVLFAQGFSREHGPITGDQITWIADGNVVGTGGTLDVRALTAGIHDISVRVSGPDNQDTTATIGAYDTDSGRRIGPTPGL